MTIPKIHVEEDLFSSVGVHAKVNSELYEQLLHELSSDLSDVALPTAHFFPALSWARQYTSIDAATRSRVYARTTEGGNYDPNPMLLSVACVPSLDTSNEALLHEARHWDQDVHGDLQTGQKWLNVALGVAAVGFVGGIAGLAAGIYSKNADLAGVSAFSAIVSPLGLFWYKTVGCKVERDAYRFQRDPAVLKAYGQIISYHALD